MRAGGVFARRVLLPPRAARSARPPGGLRVWAHVPRVPLSLAVCLGEDGLVCAGDVKGAAERVCRAWRRLVPVSQVAAGVFRSPNLVGGGPSPSAGSPWLRGQGCAGP